MAKKIIIEAVQRFVNFNNPVFLFGNGINLYNDPSAKKWKDLLQKLLDEKVKKECGKKKSFERVLQLDSLDEVTYPEMYDLINSLYKISEDDESNLQEESCELIKKYFVKGSHNKHYEKILGIVKDTLKAPLLTTNFDDLFEQYSSFDLEKDFRSLNSKIAGPNKYIAHFAYPWNKYFSDRELRKPDGGFAVWHIHGTIADPRSVHFGTSQYVGMCAHAKKTIQSDKGKMSKTKEEWYGDNTWLNLFYNKNLVVIGLGLSTSESFLRWLLLDRYRFLTDYKSKELNKKLHSLYLTTAEKPISLAQRLFLESCGFEIIQLSSYKELYEDLWNNWPKNK